jgi:hypothetical protein
MAHKLKKFQSNALLSFFMQRIRKFFQVFNANFSLITWRYGIYGQVLNDFLFITSNCQIMKKETFENLTLSELCDLLVENTVQLLELIDKKADGITLRDQKKNVELLQEVIKQKRRMELANYRDSN